MTAILTAANYKAYAGISGTDLDTRLAILCPIAQDLAERYCNVAGFDYTTSITENHASSGDRICVRRLPIVTLTSVSVLAPDGTATALPSTVYRADNASGVIALTGQPVGARQAYSDGWGPELEDLVPCPVPGFPEDFQNIQVAYAGGYGGAGATTPPALLFAMYRMLDGMIASTREDPSLKSESIGKYSYTREGAGDGSVAGLSSEVVGLLQPYRRVF